ncbi:MAG: hypothetical protein WC494_00330 [Candidatus Pacearchaeota archaeon]
MKRGLYLGLFLVFIFAVGLGSCDILLEHQEIGYNVWSEVSGEWSAQTFTIGSTSFNYEQKVNYLQLMGSFSLNGNPTAEIREILSSSGNLITPSEAIYGCSGEIIYSESIYRVFFPNCILNKNTKYVLVLHFPVPSSTNRWNVACATCDGTEKDYPGYYEDGESYYSYDGENWILSYMTTYGAPLGIPSWNPLDRFFLFYGDYVPPAVSLANPMAGQVSTSRNVNIIGSSDKEVYLWEVSYSGSYSGSNFYTQSGTSFNRQISFYNGNYLLNLSAWEFEEGPVGSDSASFSVAQKPTIIISAPSNNQVFSSTNNVSITATASNVNTLQNRITQWRIELDGDSQSAVNYSYTGTNLNLNRVLTNLPPDGYNLRVYGRDDSGIWGVSAVRRFSVTYNPPRLEIIYPVDGGYYDSPFIFSIELDTSLPMTSYSYDMVGPSGTSHGSFSCTSSGGGGSGTCTATSSIGAMSPGSYTLTVSAGGLSDTITFTVGPALCTPSITCEDYATLGQCGSGLSDGCENILTCGCPTGQNCVGGVCVEILNPIYRWENSAGAEISSANVGSTIFLVVESSGLATGSSATFEIYDNDPLLDDHIRDVIGVVDSSGVLKANWTISQSDYDGAGSSDDHEEYYFRVVLVSSSMTSGYLAIEESSEEPEVEIVFPKCGENFTLGDTINIEVNAFNFDSGTLTIYKVGEDNVELQLDIYHLVYGNNNFNYIFNSSLGGGNYRLVAEVVNSLGERIRRTSNIMIVDLSSTMWTFYVAACIDEPEDLSNLPSGIVRFNASSSRGVLFTPGAGSFPYQIIPIGKEDLLFKWRFSDEGGYRDNPYIDGGVDERAYLFYKIFVPVNERKAELEVEVRPLGAVQ